MNKAVAQDVPQIVVVFRGDEMGLKTCDIIQPRPHDMSICLQGEKTGRLYFRENLRYWGQLFSGICIFLLIPVHVWAFTVKDGDRFFFKELSLPGYLLEILFVTMVYVHVMLGITPLCVAAGWRDLPTKRTVCRTICTILYLLSVAAITYYTRMWVIQ